MKFSSTNSFFLALSMLLAVASLPGHGQTDRIRTQQELAELKSTLEALQINLEKNRSQEMSVLDDLNQIEKQVANLSMERQKQNRDLADLKKNKDDLEQQFAMLGHQWQSAQTELASLARSSYILGKQGGLKLLLDQEQPSQIAKSLSIYRYIVAARREQIDEIAEQKDKISKTNEEINQREIEINSLLNRLEINSEQYTNAEKSRQTELEKIRMSVTEHEQEIALIRGREVELQAILATIQTRSLNNSVSTTTPEQSSKSNNIGSENTEKFSGRRAAFALNRGKMPMPAQATVVHRYGDIRPESGLRWEGLMFGVKDGQNVNAIHSGQVVFSDWLRGYGQLIVLDHGDGYMSLYGHNRLFEVELGDLVDSGQTIALAGSSGGLEKPGLYFEIRENGAPVDPLNWCRM